MTDMNNDKKTAGAAPDPQAAPPASPKTATKRPAAAPPKEEKPVRRVGSITLGLCLIAVGVCFLLYYFAPGFNWLLVAKVGAPLALVALGVEVIWCAAHPARWKYDFLAVFGCLVLMGGAFCLTLLPLFWQQVSPERRIQTESLKDEYEQALYGSLQDTKIQLFSVHTYMDTGYGVQPQSLAELNQPGVFLSLGIDLYGPYDRTADFAKDCALLRDAVKQVAAQWGPMPEKIEFEWVNAEETVKMSISLRDAVQMNWRRNKWRNRSIAGWTKIRATAARPTAGWTGPIRKKTPPRKHPAPRKALKRRRPQTRPMWCRPPLPPPMCPRPPRWCPPAR